MKTTACGRGSGRGKLESVLADARIIGLPNAAGKQCDAGAFERER